MRNRRILLVLALATLAAPLHAQGGGADDTPDREVTYNWSTGTLSNPGIRAGQLVRFRVVDVNPLCYRVGLRAEPTEAAVDVKNLADMLQKPAPAPEQKPAPSGAAARPGVAEGGRTITDAQKLRDAEEKIHEARLILDAAEAARAEAAFVVESVTKPPCDAGRGFRFSDLFDRWKGLTGGDPNADPLRPHLERLPDATDALRNAADLLGSTGSATQQSDMGKSLKAQHDTLNGLRLHLASTLPALRGSLRSAGTRLASLAQASPVAASADVPLGIGVDRVKLTVQHFPVSGAPTLGEIVQEVPVRRRFRAFLSTGVLVTMIDQPHYDQVHRQVVRSDTIFRDSTYTTYAAQTRGPLSAISPAVQLNISVFDLLGWEGVPGLVSFGATTRSVNGSQGVEPFIGISLGLIDRLVGTLGWHVGRQEELLLTRPGETPEDVEKRAVPQGIGRGDGVGTRWTGGFFFSFSIKT